MDRAEWARELDLVDEERADAHREYQRCSDPTSQPVRESAFRRRELDQTESKGRNRRERVKLNRGSGSEQRRKGHEGAREIALVDTGAWQAADWRATHIRRSSAPCRGPARCLGAGNEARQRVRSGS